MQARLYTLKDSKHSHRAAELLREHDLEFEEIDCSDMRFLSRLGIDTEFDLLPALVVGKRLCQGLEAIRKFSDTLW